MIISLMYSLPGPPNVPFLGSENLKACSCKCVTANVAVLLELLDAKLYVAPSHLKDRVSDILSSVKSLLY